MHPISEGGGTQYQGGGFRRSLRRCWEAAGAIGDHTSWVIDVSLYRFLYGLGPHLLFKILWWATRLTFNSFKIYRHMTRIFYISGDPQLARRTLRLYVQVVGKAWEAGVGVDADTDQHWVETLIQGARMLCRLAGPSGVEDAREAGELIENAKTRLDKDNKELMASVNLGEGIWSSVMALVEYDSRTRPRAACSCISAVRCIDRNIPYVFGILPSGNRPCAAWTTAGFRPGYCKREHGCGERIRDIRFWHLLGLLLTANGQWSKARGVFEIAAGIGESDDEVAEERGANGINLQVQSFESKTGGANGHGQIGLRSPPAQPVFSLE